METRFNVAINSVRQHDLLLAAAKAGSKKHPPAPPAAPGNSEDKGGAHGPDGAAPGGIDRGDDGRGGSRWDGDYDSRGSDRSGEFLGFKAGGQKGVRRFG